MQKRRSTVKRGSTRVRSPSVAPSDGNDSFAGIPMASSMIMDSAPPPLLARKNTMGAGPAAASGAGSNQQGGSIAPPPAMGGRAASGVGLKGGGGKSPKQQQQDSALLPPPPPPRPPTPTRANSPSSKPMKIPVALYQWLRERLSFTDVAPTSKEPVKPRSNLSKNTAVPKISLQITSAGVEKLVDGKLVEKLLEHYRPRHMASHSVLDYKKHQDRVQALRDKQQKGGALRDPPPYRQVTEYDNLLHDRPEIKAKTAAQKRKHLSRSKGGTSPQPEASPSPSPRLDSTTGELVNTASTLGAASTNSSSPPKPSPKAAGGVKGKKGGGGVNSKKGNAKPGSPAGGGGMAGGAMGMGMGMGLSAGLQASPPPPLGMMAPGGPDGSSSQSHQHQQQQTLKVQEYFEQRVRHWVAVVQLCQEIHIHQDHMDAMAKEDKQQRLEAEQHGTALDPTNLTSQSDLTSLRRTSVETTDTTTDSAFGQVVEQKDEGSDEPPKPKMPEGFDDLPVWAQRIVELKDIKALQRFLRVAFEQCYKAKDATEKKAHKAIAEGPVISTYNELAEKEPSLMERGANATEAETYNNPNRNRPDARKWDFLHNRGQAASVPLLHHSVLEHLTPRPVSELKEPATVGTNNTWSPGGGGGAGGGQRPPRDLPPLNPDQPWSFNMSVKSASGSPTEKTNASALQRRQSRAAYKNQERPWKVNSAVSPTRSDSDPSSPVKRSGSKAGSSLTSPPQKKSSTSSSSPAQKQKSQPATSYLELLHIMKREDETKQRQKKRQAEAEAEKKQATAAAKKGQEQQPFESAALTEDEAAVKIQAAQRRRIDNSELEQRRKEKEAEDAALIEALERDAVEQEKFFAAVKIQCARRTQVARQVTAAKKEARRSKAEQEEAAADEQEQAAAAVEVQALHRRRQCQREADRRREERKNKENAQEEEKEEKVGEPTSDKGAAPTEEKAPKDDAEEEKAEEGSPASAAPATEEKKAAPAPAAPAKGAAGSKMKKRILGL